MRLSCAVLLAALGLGLTGCGAEVKPVAVHGKLTTKSGAPFKLQRPDNMPLPPGDPGIRIKLTPASGSTGEVYYAAVNTAESTFEVLGKDRKGMPPGKYVLTVYVGAAGGEKDSKPTPSGTAPSGAPKAEGKEVARQDVTVDGTTELNVVIDSK